MILNCKYLGSVISFAATVNLLIFCLFSGSCAAQKNASASQETNRITGENSVTPDNRISLIDDQVSFVPPAGFKALTADRLNKQLPENNFPKHIFSNSDQTGLVLVYLENFDLKPEDLPKIKKFVEDIHRHNSNWITSEITELNGNEWFHFEWEDPPKSDVELIAPVPPDGETPPPLPARLLSHYQEYTTSLNNKLLRFVFESDVKRYSQLKKAFTDSSRTIKTNK